MAKTDVSKNGSDYTTTKEKIKEIYTKRDKIITDAYVTFRDIQNKEKEKAIIQINEINAKYSSKNN